MKDLRPIGVCGVGTSGVAQKVLHVPTGRYLVLKVRPFDTSVAQPLSALSLASAKTLASAFWDLCVQACMLTGNSCAGHPVRPAL